MSIPTWMPNSELDLYAIDDFIEYIVSEAPLINGDRVLAMKVQDAEIAEDADLKRIVEDDLVWVDRYDVVTQTLNTLWYEIGGIDRSEIAEEIYKRYSHLFGWSNGDSVDAINEISTALITILDVIDERHDPYDEYTKKVFTDDSSSSAISCSSEVQEELVDFDKKLIASLGEKQQKLVPLIPQTLWYEQSLRTYLNHSLSKFDGQASLSSRLQIFSWNTPCVNAMLTGNVMIGPMGGFEISQLPPRTRQDYERPLRESIDEVFEDISMLEYLCAINPVATLSLYRRMVENTGIPIEQFKEYTDTLGSTYGQMYGSVLLGLTVFPYFSDLFQAARAIDVEFTTFALDSLHPENASMREHWSLAAKPMMACLIDDTAALDDVLQGIQHSGLEMRKYDWTQFKTFDYASAP